MIYLGVVLQAFISPSTVQAQNLEIRITIQRVQSILDQNECWDPTIWISGWQCMGDYQHADFYPLVYLDNQKFSGRDLNPKFYIEDQDDISPAPPTNPYWMIRQGIASNVTSKSITIGIRDYDPLNDDDIADLRPGNIRPDGHQNGDHDLRLTVDVAACMSNSGPAVNGDVSGKCKDSLQSAGDTTYTNSGNTHKAKITFTVEVAPAP
jgi:hypothetical protein